MISLLKDNVDLLITSRPAGNDGWMYVRGEGMVERRMFHYTLTLGDGTTLEMTHYPGVFKILAGVRPIDRFMASLGRLDKPLESLLGWRVKVCDEAGEETFTVTEGLVERWLTIPDRPQGQDGTSNA